MTELTSNRLRVPALLAGLLMVVPSVDALGRLLCVPPLPVVCLVIAAAVFVCSFGLICLGVRRPHAGHAITLGRAAVIALALAGVIAVGRQFQALACAHGRGMAAKNRAKQLVISLQLGLDEFGSTQDPWGGKYHRAASGPDSVLVWSDGPDGCNDQGRGQIAHAILRFERPFDQCYSEPYESWKELVRSAALWELTFLRDGLRRDIVWKSRNCAISLAEDLAGGTPYPRRVGAERARLLPCLARRPE